MGLLKALGIKFLDKDNQELTEGGASLINLSRIDLEGLNKKLLEKNIKITVACNLTSVLCGPEGTSHKYGPQKGADPESVRLLANALENYASIVYKTTGKDIRYIPGGGGAGGVAAGLYAFLNARLQFSLRVITEFLALEEYLRDSDIVITGEGKIDSRTAGGKVACAVALTAKKYNLPVIAIVGSIAEDVGILYYNGIDHIEPICPGPVKLEDSLKSAKEWIIEASRRIARLLKIKAKLSSVPI